MSLKSFARKRSPWLFTFNTGGCNGCDIELVAALTPKYDVERFGAVLKGSPRHADVFLITGPVTMQSEKRLKQLYEQIPEPKTVVALGNCACSGCIFRDNYPIKGLKLPVDVYLPGCPPKPEAILDAIFKALEKNAD